MSEEEQVIAGAGKAIAVISSAIKTAGDGPNATKAKSNLGHAVATVTETIDHCLIPLAIVNFGIRKAKDYFDHKFGSDMAEVTATIPKDSIVEPKASVAGPALQGLAFSHEEPDLKGMYLNLLATAMDGRASEKAHPAFVELIKQLTAQEAGFLKTILSANNAFPIMQIRVVTQGVPGSITVLSHVLDLRDGDDVQLLVTNPRLPMMVDNWIRLGLIDVQYGPTLVGDFYSWMEARPELAAMQDMHKSDTKTITPFKGVLQQTDFGRQFAEAVGLRNYSLPSATMPDKPQKPKRKNAAPAQRKTRAMSKNS